MGEINSLAARIALWPKQLGFEAALTEGYGADSPTRPQTLLAWHLVGALVYLIVQTEDRLWYLQEMGSHWGSGGRREQQQPPRARSPHWVSPSLFGSL